MSKKHIRKVEELSRLMNYILSRKPDEFGLVPDRKGFIAIKELVKVVVEEQGMGYVRESHIREVLFSDREDKFEIIDKKIRSAKRKYDTFGDENSHTLPPKILYIGVKRKAYPFIFKSGLFSGAKEHVILISDKDLALRVARRLDQKPVILEVRARAAFEKGIKFFLFGESLYLADQVPSFFINGPPLSGDLPQKRESPLIEKEKVSGSFMLSAERDPDPARRKKFKKRDERKEKTRKTKERKRAGREKFGQGDQFL